MRKALDEAFERYGLLAEVLHGGEAQETKAFLQPVTRETGEEPFSVTPLGAADEHCWRYLGPAAVEIAMGDRVRCRGKSYIVRDAAEVYAGEEIAYRWAALGAEAEKA